MSKEIVKQPTKHKLSGPQIKFCEGIAKGLNQTAAYRAAYPDCSPKSAESKSSRLARIGKVAAYISDLRERADSAAVLSLEEKRRFLADVIRTPIGSVDKHSPLAEKLVITTTEKGVTERVEIPSKLTAIQLDNKMSGHDLPIKVEAGVSIASLIRDFDEVNNGPAIDL